MNVQPSTASADELIGRILLGRYRVVRRLAEGGMGVVYLARAEGAAGFIKPVVIKLILSNFSASPQFLGMFVREAQILAQLRHPGIVDVIEFGEEDGAYVMVLEYVAGYNLHQWHNYLKLKHRSVPTEVCIQILIGVLDALHHVHTQALPDGTPLRITHRDVSPSNILLSSDGFAKLVDFGVARMEADTLFRTEGSGFRGKLAYGAPELFEGAEASPLGDVYSCAVVLHELLIGKNVFAGRTQAETMGRVMNHVPDSVHGVRDDAPDAIDEILARALAKQPAERYQGASELALALRQTLRVSEQELREQLTRLLRADFNEEMAELLGIESLARRDRAWRRFSMPPPPGAFELAADPEIPALGLPPTIHDQPTRVMDGPPVLVTERAAAYEAGDASADAVGGALTVAPPARGALRGAARVTTRPSLRWPLWAAGAFGIAVAFGAWWATSQRRQPPRIVLVESKLPADGRARTLAATAEPARDSAAVPGATSLPEPAVPSALPSAAPAADPNPDPPVPRAAAVPREGPDPAALTRAFRRKEKSVETCFADHATDRQAGEQIEIHFQVDAGGRAQRAELLPAALASTPLGACLRKVALATRFPAQGQEVSFRIPVTAHRVRVGQ